MKKAIDLLAYSFAVDHSDIYSLSIRQQSDGYSFCVIDEHINKCVAIKYTPINKAQNPFNNEPLLQLRYHNVKFFTYGAYALVPKSLIQNNNYSSFLPIEKRLMRRALTSVHNIAENIIIISHSNQWMSPKISLESYHEIELLIAEAIHSEQKSGVWSEVLSDRINIVVIKDHNIALANTYSISSDVDAGYYILAIYQQLNLSQQDYTLNITGDLNTLNPIELLKEYIKNVKVILPSIWNSEFNNIYSSYFTLQTKINLLCE